MCTYDNYKKYLEKADEKFETQQAKLLIDLGTNTQTRRKIIERAANQILKHNPELMGVYLFISLIDSQNIDINLLTNYCDSLRVDEGIRCLYRYGLLQSKISQIASFGIHRNIQETLRQYILKCLSPRQTQVFFEEISEFIQKLIIVLLFLLQNGCNVLQLYGKLLFCIINM